MFFKDKEVQVVNTKFGDYIKAPGYIKTHYWVVAKRDPEEAVWKNTLEQHEDDLCNFSYTVLSSEEYPDYYLYRIKIRSSYEEAIEAVIGQYMYRMSVIQFNYTSYTKNFWSMIFKKANTILGKE